jgi:hypothetical protein
VTVPDLRGPEPGSATRTALKASLERRTEEELAKISDQLNTSVARQLAEKRKELEARADASDAEAKRQAEQTIAQDLRALDEEHRYERVDEAIKLAALKAQLSVQGVSHDPIKAAIESKEKQLSSLSGEEERLRQKAAAELEAARVQRRDATEKELADLQASESRRVAASVQSRREKLRKDLDGSGLDVLTGKYSGSLSVAPAGAGAASRAVRERLEAESAFIGSVSASSRNLADLRQSLRTRMNSELRAVVTRIARENGLEVTFRPDDRSQDRTDWFRTRLPYVTARRAS